MKKSKCALKPPFLIPQPFKMLKKVKFFSSIQNHSKQNFNRKKLYMTPPLTPQGEIENKLNSQSRKANMRLRWLVVEAPWASLLTLKGRKEEKEEKCTAHKRETRD